MAQPILVGGGDGDVRLDSLLKIYTRRAATSRPRSCVDSREATGVGQLSLLSDSAAFCVAPAGTPFLVYPAPLFSSSSSLRRSSRETCLSVTVASSIRKSTTFSSKMGARTAATAAGFLR